MHSVRLGIARFGGLDLAPKRCLRQFCPLSTDIDETLVRLGELPVGVDSEPSL